MAAAVNSLTTLEELEGFLAKNKLTGGVVLILSEDEQLRELALKSLEESLAVDYTDDFNVGRYDARDSLSEGLLAAQSYPMMADFRYVRLDHLEGLKGLKSEKPARGKTKKGDKAEKTDKDDNPLGSYLEDPLSTTLLVMNGSKMDQRTKLFLSLKKGATLFCDLKVPTRRELPQWIERRAKYYGLKVNSEAKSLLADVVGSNLQMIERSLEQLRDYVYPDKVITQSAVEEMICRSKSQSIFDMTDAIGAGDGVRALALLRNMEEDGEPALMVSSMITRHFRQLLTVAAIMHRGGRANDIAQQMGVNPFVVTKLVEQAQRVSYKGLIGAFPRLLDLDIALKSGASSDYGSIEDMLLDLLPTLSLKRR